MARSIEKTAKTVEDAIALALGELGLDQEDVDVEILNSGFIDPEDGEKKSIVRVTECVPKNKKIADYLDTIIEASKDSDETDIKYYIHEETEDGQPIIKVDITGEDVAYLIGKHGDTLYAINYIANLIVNRDNDEYTRVNIDVADYKKHREETLIRIANRAASRVIKTKKPVALDPMPASERRIIHTALQMNTKVVTESEGVEPDRHVVVKLKPYVKVF